MAFPVKLPVTNLQPAAGNTEPFCFHSKISAMVFFNQRALRKSSKKHVKRKYAIRRVVSLRAKRVKFSGGAFRAKRVTRRASRPATASTPTPAGGASKRTSSKIGGFWWTCYDFAGHARYDSTCKFRPFYLCNQ